MTPSLSLTVDDDGRVNLENGYTPLDPTFAVAKLVQMHDWRSVLPRRPLPAGEGRWKCSRCGATYEGLAACLPRGACIERGL